MISLPWSSPCLVLMAIFCPATGIIFAAEPPPKSLEPRRVTLKMGEMTIEEIGRAITKETGLGVDLSGLDPKRTIRIDWNRLEYWKALDAIALATEGRWEMNARRGMPRWVKSKENPKPIDSSVDGPFRVTAREILVRSDLDSGNTAYDLTLDIAWEPRIPIVRLDSVPRKLQGFDDAMRPLTSRPVEARNPVEGFSARSIVRLESLNRDSKRIDSLSGVLLATAAEEMLRFTFADLSKPGSKQEQKGVAVTLKKWSRDGNYWIADIVLAYPPGGPTFESFETYRLSRNRMTLVSPDGTKKIEPVDSEENGNAIRYRFKEDLAKSLSLAEKGWKLEYELPGPMFEIPVRFELKGIPLP